MRAFRLLAATLAVVVVACWNAIVAGLEGERPDAERVPERAGGRRVPDRADREDTPDGAVVEHERNWYDYLRGYHVHIGDGEGHLPEHGSLRDGLVTWWETDCMRGYTRGDDVYLCPNAPRVVRVHQAGHAPTFGRGFDPLRTRRRADGGLADEPLTTFDVMLPGRFPHSLLRWRDPRGLGETYAEWLAAGKIRRR